MERRYSKRIPSNLKATIVSEGKRYEGSIENISEGGVEYLLTSLIHVSGEFKPDKEMQLSFQMPSGETLNLTCEVKWYLKDSPEEETMVVGMKIIEPPQEYMELVKHLESEDADDDQE